VHAERASKVLHDDWRWILILLIPHVLSSRRSYVIRAKRSFKCSSTNSRWTSGCAPGPCSARDSTRAARGVPRAARGVPRAARGGTPGRALLQARFAGTVMASLSDEEKLALQVGGLSPAALRAAQARLSDTTFVLGPLISNNLTVYDVHAFHAGEAWRHKHLQSDGVRPTATCRTQRPHMRLH
jgi:hypothetical protein